MSGIQTVIVTRPAPQVVVVRPLSQVQASVPGIQGAPGAQGTPGSSGAQTFASVAVGNVQSNSVVCAVAGGVANPDLTVPAQVAAICGIAATAANSGGALTVMQEGPLTESLWNWTPGPVYCALAGGQLTQAPPSTSPGAIVQVGQAISPTTLQVGIEPAILL